MKSGVKSIGDVFRELSDNLGISKKIQEMKIIEIWDEIMGPNMVQFAKLIKVENGKAIIETKSSSWRVELNIRKESLINEINEKLGAKVISELIIY